MLPEVAVGRGYAGFTRSSQTVRVHFQYDKIHGCRVVKAREQQTTFVVSRAFVLFCDFAVFCFIENFHSIEVVGEREYSQSQQKIQCQIFRGAFNPTETISTQCSFGLIGLGLIPHALIIPNQILTIAVCMHTQTITATNGQLCIVERTMRLFHSVPLSLSLYFYLPPTYVNNEHISSLLRLMSLV